MKKFISYIKNLIIIAAVFTVFTIIANLVSPDISESRTRRSQDNSTQRIMLSSALTILTIFVYKKVADNKK